MIRDLANIALLIAAVGCIAFVIAYHILADWRNSPLGRNVMALMFVAALLLMVGVARTFFDIEQYLEWIRLCSYIAIGYVVWWRFLLLLKAQKVIDREKARNDSTIGRPEHPAPDR